jgi:hypothetical protein
VSQQEEQQARVGLPTWVMCTYILAYSVHVYKRFIRRARGALSVALLFGFGGSPNIPLTAWWAPLFKDVYFNGIFFGVYLIIGLVLIVAGLIQK